MKTIIIDGIEYVPVNSVKNTEKQIVKENIHFELYPKDAPKEMNWYEAKNYCKSLGEGWRLPTITEMFYICENKFITKQKCYWSSTEYGNFNAWGFIFVNGYANVNLKNFTLYVRAVRDIK
jgi:formylglycine-generating enzyme required for sulfatase activity